MTLYGIILSMDMPYLLYSVKAKFLPSDIEIIDSVSVLNGFDRPEISGAGGVSVSTRGFTGISRILPLRGRIPTIRTSLPWLKSENILRMVP